MAQANESEYVTLESSDGFQFVIHREAAMLSGTVKNMLSSSGQFTETTEGIIHFRDIKYVFPGKAHMVSMRQEFDKEQNIVGQGRQKEACHSITNANKWWSSYDFKEAVILEKVCKYWYYKARYLNSVTEIPHFEIEPEYALETLMAADFLDT
ncbi:hypothetical protein BGZ59_006489 [Podila verticillata]|nr:hypothetical protein BGZ59_006489 [Podila verticillata]